jgi:hypothetical protein
MTIKNILMTIALLVSLSTYSQSEKEMKRYLNVFITDKFDQNNVIFFDRKNPNKHGWDKVFKTFTEIFTKKGFQIVDNPSIAHRYNFILDYDYGYLIYAYKMQCSNLKGEIVDLSNNSEVVGTFTYSKKYDNDDIANAIATNLKSKAATFQKAQSQNMKTTKSKEERLRELKDLYDKQLIGKDEYDKAKQKILDEQ